MQTRNVACPEVERVLLSEGCRVTDKGLELLSRRCPELTHLQIQMSCNITNNALFNLVTKCTNLQHLDVTGKYPIDKIHLTLIAKLLNELFTIIVLQPVHKLPP